MNETRLPQRVSLLDDVLFREVEGEAVLLAVASGSYFGLDQVGTRIWQLLSADGDVATVKRQLLDEYDVDDDQLSQALAGPDCETR